MRLRIGVVGSSECSAGEGALAYQVGFELARAGAIVVTGGLGGVMREACRGAADGGGLSIGLLPGSDVRQANDFVAVPIPTGMGEMRNALVVRASQALIAIGGSWGTLSEIALARRTGVPVIGLESPYPVELDYPRASGSGEAVRWALEQARS